MGDFPILEIGGPSFGCALVLDLMSHHPLKLEFAGLGVDEHALLFCWGLLFVVFRRARGDFCFRALFLHRYTSMRLCCMVLALCVGRPALGDLETVVVESLGMRFV